MSALIERIAAQDQAVADAELALGGAQPAQHRLDHLGRAQAVAGCAAPARSAPRGSARARAMRVLGQLERDALERGLGLHHATA
jgi:hypothetical protein